MLACLALPEFSLYNPGILCRKFLSNNIDFLNSAPGVVYGKPVQIVKPSLRMPYECSCLDLFRLPKFNTYWPDGFSDVIFSFD